MVAVSRHALETLAALPPVVEASGADVSEVRLDARLIAHAALVAPPYIHQTVGIFVGQRFKNDAVEDAKNRGVGPNAERESENDDKGEDRFLQQCARAEAQVLPDYLQVSLLKDRCLNIEDLSSRGGNYNFKAEANLRKGQISKFHWGRLKIKVKTSC